MYSNHVRWVVFAVTLCALPAPSVLMAQPGGGPPRGPGGFGGPFGGGGVLGVVMREEVQQELQLIDSQIDQVANVADEMRQKIGDEMGQLFSQMRDFRDMSDDERQALRDQMQTRLQELNSEMEAQLKKVLLPHQFERLKQIELQSRIERQGTAALTSGELAEALNLTDEQRERLEQRAAEVEQELQEKIAQLRIEARNKMLDVLTPEQQAKLNSLMGDAFALPDSGFGPGGFVGRRGRGFGFGGFGGRGAERQRDRGQR